MKQLNTYSFGLRFACFLLIIAGIPNNVLLGQKEYKEIRKGNEQFEKKDFNQSEIEYRKAIDANAQSLLARYNLADALYKQGRFQESSNLLSELSKSTNNPAMLSAIYHNMGNSLLKDKKLEESIEAYKNSLRINPADDQTRYNLAYAQSMLKQQQKQQKQNQKDNNNKDQNKDKKDQDQGKNQDQKKDQQQQQDQQAQNKQQQQQQQQQQQNQGQQKQGMSKEEAERLLQALMNQEKQTREKMSNQQFKGKKVRTDKEW